MNELQQVDGYQVPSFEEWFEAKHFQTFENRYCWQGNHQNAIFMAYIRHSHEYMQEQLQVIADHAKPSA